MYMHITRGPPARRMEDLADEWERLHQRLKEDLKAQESPEHELMRAAVCCTIRSELEINRKPKEEVMTPRKNPQQRKRIIRVPFNDH